MCDYKWESCLEPTFGSEASVSIYVSYKNIIQVNLHSLTDC